MIKTLEVDFKGGMKMLFDKNIFVLGFKETSAGLFICYFTEVKK